MSNDVVNIVDFQLVGYTTANHIPMANIIVDKLPSNFSYSDVLVDDGNGNAVIESCDGKQHKGVIKDLGWYHELSKSSAK